MIVKQIVTKIGREKQQEIHVIKVAENFDQQNQLSNKDIDFIS